MAGLAVPLLDEVASDIRVAKGTKFKGKDRECR